MPQWYAARALTGKDDDGLSPLARAYRTAGPWLGAAWQLTGSTLVGVAMGYGVDRWLGVGPWGLIVGSLVGSAVGFYAFFSAAIRLSEGSKKQ